METKGCIYEAFLFTLILFFSALPIKISHARCDTYQPLEYHLHSSAAEYATKGLFSLDNNGILVFDYGKNYNGIGKWHNPFFISNYAHALYQDWYNSDCSNETIKKSFLDQALFLLNSKKDAHKNMSYWVYPFENTYFGVGPGWISGIGQSMIAGVLYRAYDITKEERFKTAALQAIEVYLHDVESGGVVTSSTKGLWIQEVPSPDGRNFNILNGHITGLLGVYDMAKLTEDRRLYAVFQQGLSAVRTHLPEFDAGFSSFYSLKVKQGEFPKIAPLGGYNKQHAWQLDKLYLITGDEIFKQYSLLFKGYEKTQYARTAKGSIDPVGHGPDHAAGKFGVSYWSHGDFPTWYQIDFEKIKLLDALFIGSETEHSFPTSFTLSVFRENKWFEIFHTADNRKKNFLLSFDRPIEVSKIRIDIQKTDDKLVALNAVMPIQSRYSNSPDRSFPPKVSLTTLSPGFRRQSGQ